MFRNIYETLPTIFIMFVCLVIFLIMLIFFTNAMSYLIKIFILDFFDFDRKPYW